MLICVIWYSTAPSDYTPLSTSTPITIPAGDTSVSVEVDTIENDINEDSEIFDAILFSTTGAVFGADTIASVSITDNDRKRSFIAK